MVGGDGKAHHNGTTQSCGVAMTSMWCSCSKHVESMRLLGHILTNWQQREHPKVESASTQRPAPQWHTSVSKVTPLKGSITPQKSTTICIPSVLNAWTGRTYHMQVIALSLSFTFSCVEHLYGSWCLPVSELLPPCPLVYLPVQTVDIVLFKWQLLNVPSFILCSQFFLWMPLMSL